MWFLSSIALAAGPTAFPVVSEVQLPPTGVARIAVPPELRSAEDVHDGSDLLLIDAEGKTVPFAVRRSDDHREWVRGEAGRGEGDLRWWPLVEEGVYQVEVGEAGIDALEVQLRPPPRAATVRIYDGDNLLITRDVWSLRDSHSDPLPVDVEGRSLRVEIEGTPGALDATFAGVRYANSGGAVQRRVAVEPGALLESGWVRYPIPAGAGLPVRSVLVHPERTLFERSAMVWSYDASLPKAIDENRQSATIRRMDLGGRRIEQLTLPVRNEGGHDLALFVDGNHGGPLEIPEVTLSFAGMSLLVEDAGPGPHQLFGGAPRGTTRISDIQFAAAELARVSTASSVPSPISNNPKYRAPEVRNNSAAPAGTIDLRGFTARASVKGPTGLVRIPLSVDVLQQARPDLGDLRLVDERNRQIPYVLVREPDDWSWGELPFERREDNDQSYLEIPLPSGDIELGAIEIHTDAIGFRRYIQLATLSGAQLHTLRATTWQSNERAVSQRLNIDRRVGDKLVLIIHNGDNPPLPVTTVRVSRAAHSMLAYLPGAESTLYLGDPRREAPTYDFSLHRATIASRAKTLAELGPVEPRSPTPVRFIDGSLVVLGVGTMALGLLGLLLLLLRKPSESSDSGKDGPEQDESDQGQDAPEDQPDQISPASR